MTDTTQAAPADETTKNVLYANRDEYFQLVASCRDEGFNMCVDLCAVDYLKHPGRNELPTDVKPERFEVVVNLISHSQHKRVQVRAQVPESDPELASLFTLYPGTEAMEREAFDMMGIRFTGHPDLTRILMPEDWEGHPLRKDYSIGHVPVQFKAARSTR